MCGIFGLAAGPQANISKSMTKKSLKKLFLLSESRGQEAAGIASRFSDSTVVLRAPVKASEFIKTPAYRNYTKRFDTVEKEFAVIGHCRLVTDGYQSRHENNQPVISSEMVGVHNGIIVNKDEIYSKNKDLTANLDVDTESILDLCQKYRRAGFTLSEALSKTFNEIRGSASVGLLFEDLGSMALATNNGSLYYFIDLKEELLFFASEAHILRTFLKKSGFDHSNVKQLQPDMSLIVDYKGAFAVHECSLNHPVQVDGIKDRNTAKIVDIVSTNMITSSPQDMSKADASLLQFNESNIKNIKRCTVCLLPETFPFISYDRSGKCSYCHSYIPIKKYGEKALVDHLASKENILLALSGGRDSCYAMHYLAKKLNKKVTAYTYDWGVVTDLARRNMSIMCQDLNIEHIIVSADINKKRENIRKNVSAWLKRPSLGMVPLFMAGDKQFFYYANRVKEQISADAVLFGMNELERTNFKVAFCDIKQKEVGRHFGLGLQNQVEMIYYYLKQFLLVPSYINSSIVDTMFAYFSYYLDTHDYLTLYHYLPWHEKTIEDTLIGEYGWNTAPDTTTTWRIGDGTAAFYNYIYLAFAGFTESDTFRSNQIREGLITREEAFEKVLEENRPRFEAIKWYCNVINLDFNETINRINQMASHQRDLRETKLQIV